MSEESPHAASRWRSVAVALFEAVRKSHGDHAKDMAASIAYFTFLSVFPLLLATVSIGTYFLEVDRIRELVDRWVVDSFPGSAEFVTENVDAMLRLRGPVGGVSLVGLLWTASKMVGALSRALNRALGTKREHPVYLSPLRNLLMTASVSGLVCLSMTLSTTVNLVLRNSSETLVSPLVGYAAAYLVVMLVLGLLYKLVSYEGLAPRHVWPGAAFAALLLEAGKVAFVFYLGKVSRLELVYGSLTSIIVLLLWLYYAATAILLGGELIAVLREDPAQ